MQKSISIDALRKIEIRLPSLPEQRKIAEVLSCWDEGIQTLTKFISTKQTRKKALLQQLLTGKRRLKGFKESEWREVKAGGVFRNVSVKNHPDEELLSATQERGVIPRSMLEGRVAMPESETRTYKLVEKGDFIISLRSFQGGIEYSEYKGIVSPAYTVLKPSVSVYKEFYKHYFKSDRFIRKLGVAIIGIRDGKQISFADFSMIAIPLPDFKEQQAIAVVLSAASDEITLLQKQLEMLREQKRGLMQQLFSGKKRVKFG